MGTPGFKSYVFNNISDVKKEIGGDNKQRDEVYPEKLEALNQGIFNYGQNAGFVLGCLHPNYRESNQSKRNQAWIFLRGIDRWKNRRQIKIPDIPITNISHRKQNDQQGKKG